MKRDDVVRRLKELEPQLRQRGVLSLFLFGSHARDEAGLASDIDLFFDDDPSDPMSYFSVMGVEQFIRGMLETEVDLIPRDSLHRLIRDDVVASAQKVY
jgi:hypothetical protein